MAGREIAELKIPIRTIKRGHERTGVFTSDSLSTESAPGMGGTTWPAFSFIDPSLTSVEPRRKIRKPPATSRRAPLRPDRYVSSGLAPHPGHVNDNCNMTGSIWEGGPSG